MECHSCHDTNYGIIDNNHRWCVSCGTSMQEAPTYVQGYNNQHYVPRQQVYDRLKRFSQWTIARVTRPDIREALRMIMNYFSCYEFTWHMRKELTNRIYFFAKPVMLKVCCKHLGISTENLPSLKDLEREADQMRQLERLTKVDEWQLVFNSKVKTVIHL